jgi:hypothetical protein
VVCCREAKCHGTRCHGQDINWRVVVGQNVMKLVVTGGLSWVSYPGFLWSIMRNISCLGVEGTGGVEVIKHHLARSDRVKCWRGRGGVRWRGIGGDRGGRHLTGGHPPPPPHHNYL